MGRWVQRPIPVGEGMEGDVVRIERLAFEGDGVGHLEDGKVVFIPGTCPGDLVRTGIRIGKDSFARGEVLEILAEGPNRIDPACPNRCNACPWQHIRYQTQLEWKRTFVEDSLRRIGGLDTVTVKDCIPSDPWGTRNKLELEVQHPGGKLELGLHSPAFSSIDDCPMADKGMVGTIRSLRGALRFLEGKGELGIDRIGIRSSARTGDLEIALWTAPGSFPRKAVGRTLQDAVRATSITRVMHREKTKARKVVGVEALAGKGFWNEELLGETLSVSSPSFFQVNTAGAEHLVNLALGYLDTDGTARVADLYCGVGTFTIPLSKVCGQVVGIEMEGSSVRDLRRNLKDRGCQAEAIGGDVARELPVLGHFDAAVADPPRSGLSTEALDALLVDPPERLAYVSCNPATLARDVKRLTEDAYHLVEATPVDLFPQTFHVETVALLQRAR